MSDAERIAALDEAFASLSMKPESALSPAESNLMRRVSYFKRLSDMKMKKAAEDRQKFVDAQEKQWVGIEAGAQECGLRIPGPTKVGEAPESVQSPAGTGTGSRALGVGTRTTGVSGPLHSRGPAGDSAAPGGGISLGLSQWDTRRRAVPAEPAEPVAPRREARKWVGGQDEAALREASAKSYSAMAAHGNAQQVQRNVEAAAAATAAAAAETEIRGVHRMYPEVELKPREGTNVLYAFETERWLELDTTRSRHQLVALVLGMDHQFLETAAPKWSARAMDFSEAYHEDNLVYKDQDGIVNPKKYSGSVQHNLYLCYTDACTSFACEHGARCRGSHMTLSIEDLMKIALTEKGREFLLLYGIPKYRPSRDNGVPIAPMKPKTAAEQEKVRRYQEYKYEARHQSARMFHADEIRRRLDSHGLQPVGAIVEDDHALAAKRARDNAEWLRTHERGSHIPEAILGPRLKKLEEEKEKKEEEKKKKKEEKKGDLKPGNLREVVAQFKARKK